VLGVIETLPQRGATGRIATLKLTISQGQKAHNLPASRAEAKSMAAGDALAIVEKDRVLANALVDSHLVSTLIGAYVPPTHDRSMLLDTRIGSTAVATQISRPASLLEQL
jgi:hypothetical protein